MNRRVKRALTRIIVFAERIGILRYVVFAGFALCIHCVQDPVYVGTRELLIARHGYTPEERAVATPRLTRYHGDTAYFDDGKVVTVDYWHGWLVFLASGCVSFFALLVVWGVVFVLVPGAVWKRIIKWRFPGDTA